MNHNVFALMLGFLAALLILAVGLRVAQIERSHEMRDKQETVTKYFQR